MTKAEIFKKIWRGGNTAIGFYASEKSGRTAIQITRDNADHHFTIPEFRAFLREGNQALTAWEGREK